MAALRQSFNGFDAGAPLIRAMLRTPQGLAVRKARQPTRRAMFERCVDAAAPGLPAEVRSRAASALQVLYSAPAWDLLRSLCELDGAEAAEVVALGIRALLAGLPTTVPSDT